MKPPPHADELFQLELKIAQRADQLARLYGTDPARALDHWRQAELEIWRQADKGVAEVSYSDPQWHAC